MIKLILKSVLKSVKLGLNKVYKEFKKLEEFMNSYTAVYKKDLQYDDLAPKDDVPKGEAYITALDWAISNEKIQNVALTGPYGSGKSSILNTYQKKRSHFNFLKISLASFFDTLVDKQSNQEGLQNQEKIVHFDDLEIEKSILQQLFYKVDYSKIPYSRFRKIKNITFLSITIRLILVSITAFISYMLLYPKTITKIQQNIEILSGYNINRNMSIFLYIMFGLIFVFEIASIIRYLNAKIRLSKFSFQKIIEVETNKLNDDSVFNKYIDEILYYFEVTNYNVVFIEDLDRLKSTKIFIKLRELNSLINNSEQINRKVVFIYAVKDDMFMNKDRTKFFDFIIPVIPVINASNSGEKLLEKIKNGKFEEEISKEYINGISVYIDDMRILTNIHNEFLLYKKILTDVSLKSIQMFSLIVYKNLYPNDFSNLQYCNGLVYKAFEGKNDFINRKVDELIIGRKENEVLLQKVDSDIASSIVELKASLLYNLLNGFFSVIEITVDYNTSYSISTFMNETFDLNLLVNKDFSVKYYNNNGNYVPIKTSLKIADERSGSKYSYLERWKYLEWMNEKSKNEIKKKIDESKKNEVELISVNLKDLLNRYQVSEVLSNEVREEKLIVYLLRNGFIDETYPNYLTYFYPNSLTAQDMNFVLSIRNHEKFEPEYKLSKIEQIIWKLNDFEFDQKEILNYFLLDYLFENIDKNYSKVDKIISQLSDESEISFSFIDGYFSFSKKYKEIFFQMLCSKWPFIWVHICNQEFSSDKQYEFLRRILKYANIEDIVIINQNSYALEYEGGGDTLSNTMLELPDFLRLTRDIELNKWTEIVENLELYFKDINVYDEDKEKIDFIIENNYYQINDKMIYIVLEYKSKNDIAKFYEANLTTIYNSGYEKLISYIDNNQEVYIKNVFLKLDRNTNEDINVIIKILKGNLDYNYKLKIIEKENFVLESIESVDNELWNDILEKDKISTSWECIFRYFLLSNTINDTLFNYIKRNWIYLSKSDNFLINDVEDKVKKEFMESFLLMDFPDDCYESIITMINYKVDIDIRNLNTRQIKILIKICYLDLNNKNFLIIKEKSNLLHIDYLLSSKSAFIENVEGFKIDTSDLELILKHPDLTNHEKLNIISHVSSELFTSNVARQICSIIDNNYNITEDMFNTIWDLLDSKTDKLKLMTRQLKNMSSVNITKYLKCLEGDYNTIAQPGKRVKMEYSDLLFELAEGLEKIGYISSKDIVERGDPILFTKKKYIQFNTKRKIAI